MTYVVTEACIRCKYMDCLAVCPVDCFREGENMLVIEPTECIDCGACERACPPRAIVPDTHAKAARWKELNAQYARSWPAIARKGAVFDDADAHRDEPDKFRKYFSPRPARAG
jgi:ferredoxin